MIQLSLILMVFGATPVTGWSSTQPGSMTGGRFCPDADLTAKTSISSSVFGAATSDT